MLLKNQLRIEGIRIGVIDIENALHLPKTEMQKK